MEAQRKDELKKLGVYYGSLVAEGLFVGGLGPSLADFARQTGTDLSGISLVLVMKPLGYLFGALIGGWWMDRHKAHPFLAFTTLACAGLMVCLPQAGSLALLSALILLLGLGIGLLDVSANTLLSRVFDQRLGPYLVGMHFCFGLGAFVGPLLVGWSLSRHGHVGWAYILGALLMLPLALAFARVPSPPLAEPKAKGHSAAAKDHLLMALFVGIFFLYGGIEAGFGSWIYQYAVNLKLAPTESAALLTSLFWGLLGLGRLVGVPLLVRVTPRQLLTGLIPLALASLALLLACSASARVLWLGTAGMGLGMSCIFPTLLVLADQCLEGHGGLDGSVTSLLFVGSSIGGMALPWVMGQCFAPLGPRTSMALVWVALAGLAGIFAWIRARTRAQGAVAADTQPESA